MPVSVRRHLLRDRTAAAHAALDARVGELASLADYRRYLRGLHAFRAPAERRVAGGLAAAPELAAGWEPTEIAELMRADMADLGMPADPPAEAEAEIAAVSGPSGLAGLVYVLEGSAFGARLLVRQAEALGLRPDHGARHLAAQAASLDAWRGFLAALDALPGFDEAEAVASAEAAFGAAMAAFAALDAEALPAGHG